MTEIELKLRQIYNYTLEKLLPVYQKLLVWRLRHKKQVNVVFIASSLAMWRYQELYRLLNAHPKFNVSIVIVPFRVYTEEQQRSDVNRLSGYFKQNNTPFLFGINEDGTHLDMRKTLHPDVLFYPQPYLGNHSFDMDYHRFYDRLLCYTPYAFWQSKGWWSYNLHMHRRGWKLFYTTDLHRKDAVIYSNRKDRNVEVVGYLSADQFLQKEHKDIWKEQSKTKKRIIWAPHFTINEGGLLYQSNFLWMSHFMIELAKRYSEEIQFVFKPHPRLYSELCSHKDWGVEKTKDYYAKWAAMENTQLAEGEYVDLFMTSDAMIHDSGSFTIEYLYTGNPVMYIAQDVEEQFKDKNDLAKCAIKLHYIGKTESDIEDFIVKTVLQGEDKMRGEREKFYNEYLLPPNGKTASQNIMDVFLKAFC